MIPQEPPEHVGVKLGVRGLSTASYKAEPFWPSFLAFTALLDKPWPDSPPSISPPLPVIQTISFPLCPSVTPCPSALAPHPLFICPPTAFALVCRLSSLHPRCPLPPPHVLLPRLLRKCVHFPTPLPPLQLPPLSLCLFSLLTSSGHPFFPLLAGGYQAKGSTTYGLAWTSRGGLARSWWVDDMAGISGLGAVLRNWASSQRKAYVQLLASCSSGMSRPGLVSGALPVWDTGRRKTDCQPWPLTPQTPFPSDQAPKCDQPHPRDSALSSGKVGRWQLPRDPLSPALVSWLSSEQHLLSSPEEESQSRAEHIQFSTDCHSWRLPMCSSLPHPAPSTCRHTGSTLSGTAFY